MGLEKNVGGRDRLVRAVLAVTLTIVAVRALRQGRRKTGLLAGLGALSFGFNATTGVCGLNELLDLDTTGDGDLGEQTEQLLQSQEELEEATE